jgi:hypothetical protein
MKIHPLPTRFVQGLFALLIASAATASAQQTIQIDFGSNTPTPASGTPGATWNNVTIKTGSVGILKDSDGTNTSVSLALGAGSLAFTDGAATAASGVNVPGFPTTALNDFLAGNTTVTPTLIFTGLDITKSYTFNIFASRSTTDNRTTVYTFSNDESVLTDNVSVSLNASGNVSTTALVSSFAPSASGVITLTLSRDVGNTVFTYINAMTITAVSNVPEPSTYAAISGLIGLGFCVMRRRLK